MLYLKMYNAIKKNILDGDYKEGERLPSEGEFAIRFKTTRMTVRRSLQMLVNEGFIVNQPKSGYFVCNSVLISEFKHLNLLSLKEIHPNSNIQNEVLLFEYISCPEHIAKKLNIRSESPVIHGIRKRFVDGKSIQLENVYMPLYLLKGFTKSDYSESVYEYVEQTNKINYSIKSFSAGFLPDEFQEYAPDFKGKPLIITENISTFKNGEIFEYSQNYHLDQTFKTISYRKK